MLQQTQTERVVPKYENFLTHFPTLKSLAMASVTEVLQQWVGLGYNRRALLMKRTAELLTANGQEGFPTELEELLRLPGIGPYTARAIRVFAFNKPEPLLETNTRTVLLYHFGEGEEKIADAELEPLLRKAMDKDKPREWFWGMMDYGVVVKRLIGNFATKSKAFTRQSKFEGSHRQLRAQLVREVLRAEPTIEDLQKIMKIESVKMDQLLKELTAEGFIEMEERVVRIKK